MGHSGQALEIEPNESCNRECAAHYPSQSALTNNCHPLYQIQPGNEQFHMLALYQSEGLKKLGIVDIFTKLAKDTIIMIVAILP